jgi:hypothetical protein
MNKDDLRHLDTNVDLAMYALAHDDDFLMPSDIGKALKYLHDAKAILRRYLPEDDTGGPER